MFIDSKKGNSGKKVNLGGRPLKFKTPQKLAGCCDRYFNNTKQDEWTITGLAMIVGSKQLIQDYEKRKGFRDVILEAKLLVENGYEVDLKKHGRSGTIFALKNFNWKDKSETDITSGGKPLPLLKNVFSDNSDKEIIETKEEN